jgi:hypothetical protein
MSPSSSPAALYHSIPQELVGESHDNEEQESELAFGPPQTLVDARISWIYFLLGCSVLLPWNGMCSLGFTPVQWVYKLISDDYGHPLLPLPTCRFPTKAHIRFILNHLFYCRQFCLLGSRYRGI